MEYIAYLVMGSFAGILAGLLGMGGGIIVVPMLILVFGYLHFPPILITHMAVGTSFAVMIFTTMSSSYAYYRRDLVILPLFYRFLPGLLAGTLIGSLAGRQLSSDALRILFALFLIPVAINMFFSKPPKQRRDLPGFLGMSALGAIAGICSGFFGIGGGVIIVPFFTYCNVEMRKATGTSSLCGLFLAVLGAVLLMITGSKYAMVHGAPAGSVGFVYWPAALIIAMATIFFAPLGTRLAVWLPSQTLKRVFSVVMVITALSLIFN